MEQVCSHWHTIRGSCTQKLWNKPRSEPLVTLGEWSPSNVLHNNGNVLHNYGNVLHINDNVLHNNGNMLHNSGILLLMVCRISGVEEASDVACCPASLVARGRAMASFVIARCFQTGQSVDQQLEKAQEFYQKVSYTKLHDKGSPITPHFPNHLSLYVFIYHISYHLCHLPAMISPCLPHLSTQPPPPLHPASPTSPPSLPHLSTPASPTSPPSLPHLSTQPPPPLHLSTQPPPPLHPASPTSPLLVGYSI